MARNQSDLINWSQYIALRAVVGFAQCFEMEQGLEVAEAVGSFFCRTNPRRRARAEHHIACSFPGWSQERTREVAERSMQHMFQLFMVDALAMPRLVTPQTWSRHVHLEGVEPVVDLLVSDRPMLLITGHFGNWEMLGYALSVIGYPVTALARPIDNPLINAWLLGIREVRGLKVVTKWGATPVLQETLRAGGRVGLIADQNAGDNGLFVPFFGRLASSYKSIALLAMSFEVPIVVGQARRMHRRVEYDLVSSDIIEPEDWADQPDPLFYITARFNHAMEQLIRDAPEQYLWMHRRWKSRPRHERQGRPMPDRLLDKLRSLPWMTSDDIDAIVEDSARLARENAGR